MRITIPDLGNLQDVRLFSVNPHMHLIGTHISATIERPAARGSDPQNECLANGGWNFDWQRTYIYDAPLEQLPAVAGRRHDRHQVQLEQHDRRTRSSSACSRTPASSQPIDIALGEQTTNEMCLEIFGLSIPAPAAPAKRGTLPQTIEFPAGLAQMRVNAAMLQ